MRICIEQLLAKEILPSGWVYKHGSQWGDGRYAASLLVRGGCLMVALTDFYASVSGDDRVEWIWSYRVDLADPTSIDRMQRWLRQQLARQEDWNPS